MSYWDKVKLREATLQVLAEPEMSSQITSTGQSPDYLADHIDPRPIEESAASAVAAFDSADKKREAAEEKAKVAGKSRINASAVVVVAALSAVVVSLVWNVVSQGFSATVQRYSNNYLSSLFGLAVVLTIVSRVAQNIQNWLNGRKIARARSELHVADMEAERDVARKAADDAVSAAIRSELRLFISHAQLQSYDTRLDKIDAPGLSEVFNARYEITTHAKDKLRPLLESMPGGSIGIAGPRGAGKTTLMWAFCGGAIQKLNERKLLPVMIAAPVNYDAREFILHLFASLCRRVRALEGAAELDEDQPLTAEGTSGWTSLPYIAGRRVEIAMAPAALGVLLVAIAIFLAWAGLGPTRDAWVVTTQTLLRNLGFSPAPLLVIGVASIILSILLLRVFRPVTIAEPEESVLAKTAKRELLRLRFQQSYSVGWSGSLKLPSLEGGVNSAVQLAQKQVSLPEVVEKFKSFVTNAARANEADPYQVIIGIDELDKISDEQKANQFLNDIKAVFGIERCFYLVSVSENAMSSFERRGLPFRDAFDSAFDSVVYIEYLNLEGSSNLLRRRVIGLPVPFIALCHCLSGGLPRELIRVCRELVGSIPSQGPPLSLADACARLARADLLGKVRATVSVGQRIEGEEQVGLFLDQLRQFESVTVTVQSLREWSQTLQGDRAKNDQVKDAEPSSSRSKARDALQRLRAEISAYAYYLATLLEVFSSATDESVRRSEKEGHFELLAKARQAFEVDPLVARSLVANARVNCGLDERAVASGQS